MYYDNTLKYRNYELPEGYREFYKNGDEKWNESNIHISSGELLHLK